MTERNANFDIDHTFSQVDYQKTQGYVFETGCEDPNGKQQHQLKPTSKFFLVIFIQWKIISAIQQNHGIVRNKHTRSYRHRIHITSHHPCFCLSCLLWNNAMNSKLCRIYVITSKWTESTTDLHITKFRQWFLVWWYQKNNLSQSWLIGN